MLRTRLRWVHLLACWFLIAHVEMSDVPIEKDTRYKGKSLKKRNPARATGTVEFAVNAEEFLETEDQEHEQLNGTGSSDELIVNKKKVSLYVSETRRNWLSGLSLTFLLEKDKSKSKRLLTVLSL